MRVVVMRAMRMALEGSGTSIIFTADQRTADVGCSTQYSKLVPWAANSTMSPPGVRPVAITSPVSPVCVALLAVALCGSG